MLSDDLISPRFIGARFEDGIVPLAVVSDVKAIGDLILKVARRRVRQSIGKSRLPNGFDRMQSIAITAVKPGSAILKLALITAGPVLFSPHASTFQDAAAQVVRAVGAAESEATDDKIVEHLTREELAFFDQIARHLNEGESLELIGPKGELRATLSEKSRQRLVLASSGAATATKDVRLIGRVSEISHPKKTFTILTSDGVTAKASLVGKLGPEIVEAVSKYEDGHKVCVRGRVLLRQDVKSKKLDLKEIDEITTLDPFDIEARLLELAEYQAGWLDGEGQPLDREGVRWLIDSFAAYYPAGLPLPAIFASPEGGVNVQWDLNVRCVTLDIDLVTRQAEWHDYNFDTQQADERPLDLKQTAGWQHVVQRIGAPNGEAEE